MNTSDSPIVIDQRVYRYLIYTMTMIEKRIVISYFYLVIVGGRFTYDSILMPITIICLIFLYMISYLITYTIMML